MQGGTVGSKQPEWCKTTTLYLYNLFIIIYLQLETRVLLRRRTWRFPMKTTLKSSKFALSALLAGALMLLTPGVTLAQHRGGGGGGGGGHFSGGGGGGQRGFS